VADVLLVALTGGIGSGKSTVAAGLAERGAVVIDADAISRQILEPGGLAYQAVVDHFGPGVVRPDRTIDRPALAAAVFGNPAALEELNRLTHPAIGQVIADRVRDVAEPGRIVVVDIPLLAILAKDLFQVAAVMVVDTPEDVAVERLVAQRHFSEEDAWARVAAQTTRHERRQLADLVLDNRGDRRSLDGEIDRAWAWLQEQAARV
jgi:dephospho-CoA kinase